MIHCSDTKPSHLWVNEDEIREWHLGRGWDDAGYNIVIPREPFDRWTGYIEVARALDRRGAHVAGYNHRSLGICLVGGMSENEEPEDNFLPEQWRALDIVGQFLMAYAPKGVFCGHCQLDNSKTCPNFDVPQWARDRGYPTLEDFT